METLGIKTSIREGLTDITTRLENLVQEKGWTDGMLFLFCPHTTAALTINEAADPSVASDITAFLHRTIPKNYGFTHLEGNSDAHVKSSLLGPDLTLMVEDGRILLGTWQGVYFYDGDGPRVRSLWVKFLPCAPLAQTTPHCE